MLRNCTSLSPVEPFLNLVLLCDRMLSLLLNAATFSPHTWWDDTLYILIYSVPPQATVLEEMPPFPERESSILAKLKRKKGPGHLPDIDDARRNVNGSTEHSEDTEATKKVTPLNK